MDSELRPLRNHDARKRWLILVAQKSASPETFLQIGCDAHSNEQVYKSLLISQGSVLPKKWEKNRSLHSRCQKNLFEKTKEKSGAAAAAAAGRVPHRNSKLSLDLLHSISRTLLCRLLHTKYTPESYSVRAQAYSFPSSIGSFISKSIHS